MDLAKRVQKEEKKSRRQSWTVSESVSKGLAGGAPGSALLKQKSKDDLDLHFDGLKAQLKEAQQAPSSAPHSPHSTRKKTLFGLFASREKDVKKEKKEKKSKKDKAIASNDSTSSASSVSSAVSSASDKSFTANQLSESQNSDVSITSSPSSLNSSDEVPTSESLTASPSSRRKIKSFLSTRNIRKSMELESSPSSSVNSNASTTSVSLDKTPRRTLTIASSLHEKFGSIGHSASGLQRRASILRFGLASSGTDRKVKKDVISKLKYINETEPYYLQSLKSHTGTDSKNFDEDDFKQVAKHLIDLEHLSSFFNAEDVADYNKTHGDGVNLSSRDYFRKVHIQTIKRQEKHFESSMSPALQMQGRQLTLTASPSVEFTDEDEKLWSVMEEQVKDYFWNVWPLKVFLTTGCGSKSKTGELDVDNYAKPFAALQIGNRVLEWGRSSLCIPFEADYYFGNCLTAVELNFLEDVGALLKEDLDKICPLIADWNANKTFNSLNCNSQDFVDILLTALGFQPLFRNKLGVAMKELQSSLNPLEHQFKLTLQINLDTVKVEPQKKQTTLVRTTSTVLSQDVTSSANIKSVVAQAVAQNSPNRIITKTIAFRSHKDVDLGYHDLRDMNVLTKEDFSYLLLIDRIYWLWWSVTSSEDPSHKPSLEQRELKARATYKNCYFGWPWKEGSVMEKSKRIAYSRSNSLDNPGQVLHC